MTSTTHNMSILPSILSPNWIWIKSPYIHLNNQQRGHVGDDAITFSNFQNNPPPTIDGNMSIKHFTHGWKHYFICTCAMDQGGMGLNYNNSSHGVNRSLRTSIWILKDCQKERSSKYTVSTSVLILHSFLNIWFPEISPKYKEKTNLQRATLWSGRTGR